MVAFRWNCFWGLVSWPFAVNTKKRRPTRIGRRGIFIAPRVIENWLWGQSAFNLSVLIELFNKNIFYCYLSLAASMDLKTNQSELRNGGIRFPVVDRLMAVDEESNSTVFCMDLVVVPIILLDPLEYLSGIRSYQRFVSS